MHLVSTYSWAKKILVPVALVHFLRVTSFGCQKGTAEKSDFFNVASSPCIAAVMVEVQSAAKEEEDDGRGNGCSDYAVALLDPTVGGSGTAVPPPSLLLLIITLGSLGSLGAIAWLLGLRYICTAAPVAVAVAMAEAACIVQLLRVPST